MKGVVEKLCDIDRIVIPEELLNVTIDEQKVEEAVHALALRYAREELGEVVLKGDLAYCLADPKSYPDGRTILLYTGTDVPGAKEASEAVLGKKNGDVCSVILAGRKVELTIRKILHRIPAEVTDALVAGIGLEGVTDLEGYKKYLREKQREDILMEKNKLISHYLITEMVNQSTCKYDEKEMEAHIQSCMAEYSQECEEDGVEMSQEEIRESIIAQEEQNWVAEAFCKSRGIEVDLTSIEGEADQMIEMMELMGEKVPEREEVVEMAAQNAYFEGLLNYIDEIIAKEMGGSHGNC